MDTPTDSPAPPDFLRAAVEHARERAETSRREGRIGSLLRPGGAPRSLKGALEASAARGDAAIIAEVKRASPSRGVLSTASAFGGGHGPTAAAELALRYEAAGAAAISVLTETHHFLGTTDDLVAVRQAVTLPVLRKDFLLEPFDIVESWALGADAVLLIARLLRADELIDLARLARALGLETLVEIHAPEELPIAKEIHKRSGSLTGVNARDLDTLTVDPAVQEVLLGGIDADRLPIAESGLRTAADIRRLHQAGARAFLVGEALVTADDPELLLRQLAGALR